MTVEATMRLRWSKRRQHELEIILSQAAQHCLTGAARRSLSPDCVVQPVFGGGLAPPKAPLHAQNVNKVWAAARLCRRSLAERPVETIPVSFSLYGTAEDHRLSCSPTLLLLITSPNQARYSLYSQRHRDIDICTETCLVDASRTPPVRSPQFVTRLSQL